MSGYYSCYCGEPFYTENPTVDKECRKCEGLEKEPPVKKKQRATAKLHFIRICKTRGCTTKIYRKNPDNKVDYCASCVGDHRRKYNSQWHKAKRVLREPQGDKEAAGVTL